MDMRQAWCLGFSVVITLTAIGSIATLTGGSSPGVLAADLEPEVSVPSDGAGSSAFAPVIELPDVLQAGATTNVTIGLIGVDPDAPRGAQPMVQVELGLELVPAARGWIQIPRDRHLLAADDLQRRSFALQVARAAPCGTIPGRITVTVTAADGHGQTGQVRQLLPPIACDQLPPAAPDSLHAPAGSCSAFDDDRPLAAVVVEPPGCDEPIRRRAPRSSATAEPEQGDDQEAEPADPEADEDDVEPGDGGDPDGDPGGDDDVVEEPEDGGPRNGGGPGDGDANDGDTGDGGSDGSGNGDDTGNGGASTSGSSADNGEAGHTDQTDRGTSDASVEDDRD